MDKDNTGMYDNVLAVIAWCVTAYFFYAGEPTAGAGMLILGKLYSDSTNTAIYRRRTNKNLKSGRKCALRGIFIFRNKT